MTEEEQSAELRRNISLMADILVYGECYIRIRPKDGKIANALKGEFEQERIGIDPLAVTLRK